LDREYEIMIFAAGIGDRLGDLGEQVPKALLPVWKDGETLEPVLARLIRQSAVAHARVIRVVVHHRASLIERFVEQSPSLRRRRIEFVNQETLDGEAGGLFLIEPSDLPTLAIDVDNYLSDEGFLGRLVDEYFQHTTRSDCLATIGVCKVGDITRYANVKVSDDGTLSAIVEKPSREVAFGDLAKMGCYVLSPELIKRGRNFFLDSSGQVATTAAFSNLCSKNEPVQCIEYRGGYLDIGVLAAYAEHLTNGGVAS
jgi:NDP-sugar pyrophosphorylase family protein